MGDPLALVALATGSLIAVATLVSIAWGRDWWPLSPYAMFSHPRTLQEVSVFRLAFESDVGERVFWRPHHYYTSIYFSDRVVAIAVADDGRRDKKDALLATVTETVIWAIGQDVELRRFANVLPISRRLTPDDPATVEDIVLFRLPLEPMVAAA